MGEGVKEGAELIEGERRREGRFRRGGRGKGGEWPKEGRKERDQVEIVKGNGFPINLGSKRRVHSMHAVPPSSAPLELVIKSEKTNRVRKCQQEPTECQECLKLSFATLTLHSGVGDEAASHAESAYLGVLQILFTCRQHIN